MKVSDLPGVENVFDKYRGYAGSDDLYYREHFVHLVDSGWLREVLQSRREREIIAMYLGILSVRNGELATSRPFSMAEIVENISRRYRMRHRVAEDAVSDAFANFIDSVPEITS